jgi:transmembrane sensor
MMSKKDFERILERYLNGTATEQEGRRIEKWYSGLDSENDYPVLDAVEEERIDQADLEMIKKRISAKKHRIIGFWPSLAAAAAVTLIGVIAIDSFISNSSSSVKDKISSALTDREIVNELSEIKVVKLSDASHVFLHPGSMIRIAGDFNKGDRKVTLKGEAFFDVTRDERQPFKVFTHDVVTTVLGTSFTIKAPSETEKITVVVRTGRVAVSSEAAGPANEKANRQEVIVTPNQQAVFNPESKTLKAILVQDPVALNKPDKTKEVFDEEPIINILTKIEELYGVEIQYDVSALATCRITTAFLHEGLYERLNVLSKAIGATYAVEGTTIRFESKGCSLNQ